MPVHLTKTLNRLAQRTFVPADITSSAVMIQLLIDPSEQLEIYGVHFGYHFEQNADVVNFRTGYVAGYLNFTSNTAGATVVSGDLAFEGFGEIAYHDRITGPSQGGTEVWKALDLANPLILQGYQQVTFVLAQPFMQVAAGANCTFMLYVRGNILTSEKAKLGQWVTR